MDHRSSPPQHLATGHALVVNSERRNQRSHRLTVPVPLNTCTAPREHSSVSAVVDWPPARSSIATFSILTRSTTSVAAYMVKAHWWVNVCNTRLGTVSIYSLNLNSRKYLKLCKCI
jgi:hypothetical protein